MALRVVDYENRGTKEHPYGFVYFSDERRVAYSGDQGVVQDATGGWQPVSITHVHLATNHLREKGVLS